MLIKKYFYRLLAFVLFLFATSTYITAQQTPDENNTPVVENIDPEENLLDSNQAYKKQFDSLSKDGEWIEANKAEFIKDISEETGEDLGSYYPATSEVIYIWRPYCASTYWNPYYNGRWVFSSYGWIWMSDYDWGWGPYNYGRWHHSNYYGWIWLPGTTWACNWVTWRDHNSYVGWYPTCPRVYWRHNNNIFTNKKFASVPIHWIFLNKKDFTKKVDEYTIVKADKYAEILKNSKKTTSVLFDTDPSSPKFKYSGPDVNVISKESGEKIIPKQVEVADLQSKSNSEGKQVSVFKDDGKPVRDIGSRSDRDNGSSVVKSDNSDRQNGTKSNDEYGSNRTKSGTVKDKSTKRSKTRSNDGWKTNEGTRESPPENNTKGSNETKSNDGNKSSDDNKGVYKPDVKK